LLGKWIDRNRLAVPFERPPLGPDGDALLPTPRTITFRLLLPMKAFVPQYVLSGRVFVVENLVQVATIDAVAWRDFAIDQFQAPRRRAR